MRDRGREREEYLRGCYKSMSGRIGIVSSSEVSVVRSEDGVLLALLYIRSLPLSNARSTGISQYFPSYFVECSEDTIAINSGTNLFGTYCIGLMMMMMKRRKRRKSSP